MVKLNLSGAKRIRAVCHVGKSLVGGGGCTEKWWVHIEIQDCRLLKRARAGITGRGEMQGLKCTSQLHRSGTNQCIERGGEMLA